MLMSSKSQKNIPGVAFLVDARGRHKSVLIDLEQHGPLWEDEEAAAAKLRCSSALRRIR
jgi:hypothetical protein